MVHIVHSCKHVKCTIDERIWHSTERCHLQINAHLDINFRLVSMVNITVLLSLSVISSLWQLNNSYSDQISMVSSLDFGSLGWVFLHCLYISLSWLKLYPEVRSQQDWFSVFVDYYLGSSVACLIRWCSTLLVSISPWVWLKLPPSIIWISVSVLHLDLQFFSTHLHSTDLLVSFSFLYLNPSWIIPGLLRFVVNFSIE